ncbi:MAG: DEAD/DEAH box helicase [Cyanobium sp.]
MHTPRLEEQCERLAVVLADGGRVLPGLILGADGLLRAQWWPLLSSNDRLWLAALLEDDDPDSQLTLACALEEALDREVRRRLSQASRPAAVASGLNPSLQQAWLAALHGDSPRLQGLHEPADCQALLEAVQRWVRDGSRAASSDLQLCLRWHDPVAAESPVWQLKLLLRSSLDPSLMVPLERFWAGDGPFPRERIETVLTLLGQLARLAPELAALLDQASPASLELTEGTLLTLLQQRAALLDQAGFVLWFPSWWHQGRRLGLRAVASQRQSSRSLASADGETGAGLGLDQLIRFRWQAVLGDQPLAARDIALLEAAAADKRQLVRLRGEWTLIDPSSIGRLLQHRGSSAEASGAELLRAGLGLGRLDLPAGLEISGVQLGGALGALLAGNLHSQLQPLPSPQGFVGALRAYQERGVSWLVFLGQLGLGACLADDMGLGKTAQLIATLLADPQPLPTLVVAPVTLLGNWSRELARFAPQLPVLVHHGAARFRGRATALARELKTLGPGVVLLTSYGVLSRDAALLARLPLARVVFDEAQQLKNPYTAQARAAAGLQAPRRIALTGTPVENRLSELWSLMQLLNPGLLGSLRSFRAQFVVPIERDHDREAAQRLRRLAGPFLLRRLKSDPSIAADLPEKIEQNEPCALTAEQATLYQAVVAELLAAAERLEGIDRRGAVLAGLMRLKQVCNHPAHLLADRSPLPQRSGKLQRCEELLDRILERGEKALLFTQFRAWGEQLQPYLQRLYGREVLWLHGGVPRRQRDAMVERFAAAQGPPLFLLSLKAGGTGLNLTAAAHVIHYDRWWNPAVEDQATDRAHRIGQRQPVHVHKLICNGTIEERIDAMIQRKRSLAEQVVGSGEQWITELSTDALRELIRLRPEALGA